MKCKSWLAGDVVRCHERVTYKSPSYRIRLCRGAVEEWTEGSSLSLVGTSYLLSDLLWDLGGRVSEVVCPDGDDGRLDVQGKRKLAVLMDSEGMDEEGMDYGEGMNNEKMGQKEARQEGLRMGRVRE